MSLADDILIILTSYSGGYRLMRQRIRGYYGKPKAYHPSRRDYLTRIKTFKDETLRKTLSRLKKRGLVENPKSIWRITKKGRDYITTKLADRLNFHGVYKQSLKTRAKSMIIAFDIPESYRRAREWLRYELRLLGFELLQKSVWIGPSPLPKEFIEAINELNLISYMKFFRATEEDIV